MVLEIRKNPKPTQFYMLNIFDFYNFPKKSSPGASLLSAYSWLSLALDLAQMVLDGPSLTTFASTPVSKIQSLGMPGPWSSRNLLAPPTLIRAGNPEVHPCFWALGVKRNPTVPHT